MSSAFQVKIGIRNMVMPGARMQKIVVMKFTARRSGPMSSIRISIAMIPAQWYGARHYR